jgi:hypothetical protein
MARQRTKTKKSSKARTDRRPKSPPIGDTTPKRHPKRARISSTPELEQALRDLRSGQSQRLAAKNVGIPVGRFRRFLWDHHLAKFKGHRWRFTDRRQRTVRAITTSGEREITVAGFNKASLVMKHRAAVRSFWDLPIPALLKSFEGRSVTDTSGRTHYLETRPNVLFRLAASGGEPYESVYALTT